VPVGTLWECLLLWGYANGHATLITFTENPYWFIGVMLVIALWSGFHFYWFHRSLHVGLYSDLVVYFLIASHPIHVIFNAMLHTIAGQTSHCGYDKVKLTRKFYLQLGDVMHQLHHRLIDCH